MQTEIKLLIPNIYLKTECLVHSSWVNVSGSFEVTFYFLFVENLSLIGWPRRYQYFNNERESKIISNKPVEMKRPWRQPGV